MHLRAEWEDMHRVAHSLGMRTTATMMFGCGEEYRHRVTHPERLAPHPEDTMAASPRSFHGCSHWTMPALGKKSLKPLLSIT